jgi:RNA polymerase sigma factor (TIGR02999 family)
MVLYICRVNTIHDILKELTADGSVNIESLVQVLYHEIHRNAHQQRLNFNSNLTLNTTAIVHEAYIKIADHTGLILNDRIHFLKIMSKAIRWVLLDEAKRNNAQKRGERKNRILIEDVENILFEDDNILQLDEAITSLESQDKELASIIEMRFYGAATIEEVAEALNISPSTVKRRWNFAKAWLANELRDSLSH